MRLTPEEKRNKYRAIFDLFVDSPRITVPEITSVIGGSRNTTGNRLEEAFSRNYVSNPQVRTLSYLQTREYMTFLRCESSYHIFSDLIRDERFSYHAKIIGFCDLWLISDKKPDIEGEIIHEGYRSDYYISYPPDQTWDTAIQKMRQKIKHFDEDATSSLLKTRFNESIKWTPQYKMMYHYFKYNLRKHLTPLMRENKIPSQTINDFLTDIHQYCTVFTMFFPESLPAYEPYLHMVETDYEDFVIELFSELPTTSWFFKVGGKLFMLLYPKRELVRMVNHHSKIEDLHIPMIFQDLLERDILKRNSVGILRGYWTKDL